MSLLDSLFSGVKAFVREVATVAVEAVRAVLIEIDRSAIGRAATQFIQGASRRYFGAASSLIDEERELATKFLRDGRRSSSDHDRLLEIAAERERLRKELDAARSQESARELEDRKDSIIAASITDDDASAAVGLLASKACSCGEPMQLRQRGFNSGTQRRSFYWVCTSTPHKCLVLPFNPTIEEAKVLRQPDPNFDMSLRDRRAVWTRKDVVVETAGRLRQGLDERDEAIVCPTHLEPMKLVEKPSANGTLLSTYEYVCRGVDAEGLRCKHRIPVETFAQVSEILRRREGEGIIRN